MVLNELADEETGMVWGAGIGRKTVTRLVVGLLLLSLFSPAFAQEIQWICPFSSGDDGAVGGTVDTAGNVYVIGSTGGAILGKISVANVDAFVVNLEPGTPPLEANQLLGRVPTQLDVFCDEFDQSQLREGWFWVREDPSAWSLVENPGNLRIYTQYGSLDGGIAKNVLLRRGPTSVFSITARIHINPTRDWHEAVLLLYKDDENYVKISRLYHSGLGGNVYLLFWEQNGVCFAGFSTPTSQTTVELQLIVQEDVVIGLFKNESGDWVELGRIAMDTTRSYPYVGITAHNGARYIPSIPADFDFVAVRPLARCQITGRVTDATTGKEIASAKVEASGPTTASATTDSNGNYSLSLSPGTYTLTASASGYESQVKANITVTGGQTRTVDFGLTPLGTGNRPPGAPSNLTQQLHDGSAIPVGGSTTSRTVLFRATVSDPDGDRVKLQVELRRLDELGGSFDETQGGLKESALVASGAQATATASDLIAARYHWRARVVDERGLAGPWVEFGANPTAAADFTVSDSPTRGFWGEVAHPNGSGATIYSMPTSPREVMTSVPNGWVLFVIDTHRDEKRAEGFVWWEVRDSTWPAGTSGWVPKQYLVTRDSAQLEEKATVLVTPEARMKVFLAAVLRYYFNEETVRSLYSGGDSVHSGHPANGFSILREGGFPIELVMAIALHESAADYEFDNRIYDQYYARTGETKKAGVGIMQIHGGVFPCNSCNKGWGSGLQNYRAYNAGAHKEEDGKYRHNYYGNTPQGIYANVKDAFRVLQWAWTVTQTTSATVACYNRGKDDYPALVAKRLRQLKKHFRDYEETLKAAGYEPLEDTEVEQLAASLEQYVAVRLKSPGALQVRDAMGRVTGLVGGVVRNEIPGCAYVGDGVIVFGPDTGFRYVVGGNAQGLYGITVERRDGDEVKRFEGAGIAIVAGAVHEYRTDWDALARGEEGVTLRIDHDGDGVFERTIHTGEELRGDDVGVIPTGSVVSHGPNPVPAEGCTFWFTLPAGTRSAKLLIYNVAGRLVAELPLDPGATRYPPVGRWRPVDSAGVPLANGPYVYVLIADGRVIGQGKMVIQR